MKLQYIDQLLISDHFYLTDSDKCFFLGEYTSEKSFDWSETNQLIFNLKKSLEKINTPEWKYKISAINIFGQHLSDVLYKENLSGTVFVPVPPSKCKSDPLYDNRLVQVLETAQSHIPENPFIIKEIVIQRHSTKAFHHTSRMPPNSLIKYYEIDRSQLDFTPQRFVIFDDVLTTGSHFKAVQAILNKTFPNIEIVGLFLARRVFPVEDGFEPCA
jgi:hypothetical protein